ncbi:MAG TPA: 16S rRNA (cytosine(967)-C(5))-methyltransferase RsmB [Candidatus Melainabacteria bacterium]|nr:16S rRNA (cytosine(967)-C(5))-methyltransferase RsmB [Candidatus Melainabacteria bacterium]
MQTATGQTASEQSASSQTSNQGALAKKNRTSAQNNADSKKNSQGMSSRKLALETLIKIEKDGAYANLALSAGFERQGLSEKDRAFVTALVQGVLRNQNLLDQKIQSLSKEPLAKMPPLLRNLLRMAVFQLDDLSETPAHAVLDTSNKLARALGHEGLVRYTNGVLRNYLRKRTSIDPATSDRLEAKTNSCDPEELSVQYSLPSWLIVKWIEYYGLEETRALLNWSKREPGLTVRVSEVSVEPQTMLDIMNKNGFACRAGTLVPACLIFEREDGGKSFRGSPQKLPGYDDGFFVVQDEAAAFVSLVVAPEKGETIVDLCAAPGGKTVHLAEMLENTGRVVAVDKHESRLKLVKEVRLKQGLKNLEIIAADGRQYELGKPADRVLLDAPCSGTGVINRRTDIRLNRKKEDIEELNSLQRELISNAARLVKPGGVLVYSTCSLEPEENIQVIEWFLKENPDFRGSSLLPFISEEIQNVWFSESVEAKLPAVSTKAAAEKGYIQLIPTRHGVSGFFVCRLQRNHDDEG